MLNLFTLPDSLKRRLDPKTRAMYKAGYLNDNLQRTNTGKHLILNFLEDKFEKEFVDWIKAKVKEAEQEAD